MFSISDMPTNAPSVTPSTVFAVEVFSSRVGSVKIMVNFVVVNVGIKAVYSLCIGCIVISINVTVVTNTRHSGSRARYMYRM